MLQGLSELLWLLWKKQIRENFSTNLMALLKFPTAVLVYLYLSQNFNSILLQIICTYAPVIIIVLIN